MERQLTAIEFASAIRVSAPTAYKLLRDGRINGASRIGRQWRISEDSVVDFLRSGGCGSGKQKQAEGQPAA